MGGGQAPEANRHLLSGAQASSLVRCDRVVPWASVGGGGRLGWNSWRGAALAWPSGLSGCGISACLAGPGWAPEGFHCPRGALGDLQVRSLQMGAAAVSSLFPEGSAGCTGFSGTCLCSAGCVISSDKQRGLVAPGKSPALESGAGWTPTCSGRLIPGASAFSSVTCGTAVPVLTQPPTQSANVIPSGCKRVLNAVKIHADAGALLVEGPRLASGAGTTAVAAVRRAPSVGPSLCARCCALSPTPSSHDLRTAPLRSRCSYRPTGPTRKLRHRERQHVPCVTQPVSVGARP